MKVKFWGVRGSLPSIASPEESKERISYLMKSFLNAGFKSIEDVDTFLSQQRQIDLNGYGVATTSVQIGEPFNGLIIDGGSGIKYISENAVQSRFIQKEYHILITHFHFDHIIGLPFFTPHYIPGHKITYYAVQPECEEVIKSLFRKPVFPVGYDALKAQINFVKLSPYEKKQINGYEVTPYQLDHPDPCFGFRVEKDGVTYSHAVDTEALRLDDKTLGVDAGLYKNSDLLYIDAQYLEDEMIYKKGWGHGSFERSFELAQRYNVKHLLMAHYDPSHSFIDIEAFKARAKLFLEEHYPDFRFKWEYAYEGQLIELKK